MMKIIFLDIDGVMTSARTGWRNMDQCAVAFLKHICKEGNAKMVISSTWRYNRTREFFTDIFGNDCIHEDWRTSTDLLTNGSDCRGDEIKLWLATHPEIMDYLILDDDSDMLPEQMDHLILTDSYNGLLFKDMKAITDYCNLPPANMDLIYNVKIR